MNENNTTVLLGLQWGDEGKGKKVDELAAQADIVIRFQGGSNAGHTIYNRNKKFVVHLVPSGLFHLRAQCYIGPEVVCNPLTLVEEVRQISTAVPDIFDRLKISVRTPLILPYHIEIDRCREIYKGKEKIGTTGRGIGPAYEDLAGRVSIRVIDLFNIPKLREKIGFNLFEKNAIIQAFGGTPITPDEIVNQWQKAGVFDLLPKLAMREMPSAINEAIDAGKRVLFEGAQGTLLDVTLGTSPFVTSSHTVAGAICTSFGIAPWKLQDIRGVIKAYTTRVGSGPFPTELFNEKGQQIQRNGGEFGATTGRPRRCGWLDLPAVRYAIQASGATQIIIMKADVLCGFDEVKINNSYTFEDSIISHLPIESIADVIANNDIVLPGWNNCRDDKNLALFISRIQENIPVPISGISIGPNREDYIALR